MHIPPWRRPPEPPHPPRRSRSPEARRTQELIEAHDRNVRQRRGGKAARRRTKSIHRGLLQALVTRLSQLLSIIVQGRSLYERRLRQAQDRLNWLGDPANFPTDKALVLPGARAEIEDISVESESVLETVYLESSGEEDVEYIEDPDRPYGDNEQLNRIFRRLRDQGQLEEASSSARPAVLPSSSSRPPVLSSSSLRPLVLQQRPKPKPAALQVAPPPRPLFRNLLSSEIQRLELQIREQQGPIAGAKAILSWDHHNVLDSFRTSLKRCSKANGGYYPPESRQVLQTAAQYPFIQVILSYCHAEYTVRNVLTCASNQQQISRTLISRYPTGVQGKLAVLRALVRLDTPLFHIDDSAEVIEEFHHFLSVTPSCVWKIIGISVPRKRAVPGVIYCKNVGEALSTILERTGLLQA